MEGYEVITSDDHKAGHVVDVHGENLIIETGHLRKTKHALPKSFAHADDGEKVVRATISKDVLCDSPKVNGTVDEQAVAEHYGLEGVFADVDTPEEFGDNDVPAAAAGGDTTEERAKLREGVESDNPDLAVFDRSRNANDPTGTTANR